MKRATRKGIFVGFAVVLAAGLTVPTQGWGRDGHQIAGAIAWHYLTDKAKESVVALLGNDDLPGGSCYPTRFAVRAATRKRRNPAIRGVFQWAMSDLN